MDNVPNKSSENGAKETKQDKIRCNLLNYDSVMAWLPSQQRSLAKCGTEESEDTPIESYRQSE
jgi:hypothetical protein